MKSLLRKRLFILSALLLTICGQMWAGRSGSAGASDSSNGINYTLYSNYSYYYYWSDQSQYLGNVAVITSCSNSTMVIPESLGGCNQIVIGESALTSNVKSLTISKSVKLLEYCAVYYADQIETLIIEDSEMPLYCFGTHLSSYYGAFSYIEGLKSVYIGRNLEYEHKDDDHDFAPFRACESSGNFDVTIGPNVTKIADYCFEGCNIKSLTMKRSLPQAVQKNPITFGTGAFNNTSSVPCYVSWTTLNNFQNYSDYKDMFNYQLGAEPCRYEALEKLKQERRITSYQDILGELEAGCADYEAAINNTNDVDVIQLLMTRAFAIMELLKQKRDYPSNASASIVSEYKAKIDNEIIDNIEGEKNKGKQALKYAKELQDAKTAAIAELNAAKSSNPSDAAEGIVKTYTDKINAATTTDDVTVEKNKGIQALKDAKVLQEAKAAAIAELNAAKSSYPSNAAEGIVKTYTDKINAATTPEAVTAIKEAGIQALADAKVLQDAKAIAIDALNDAKKDHPSDAAEDVVRTYTGKINAATTTDAVTTAKNEGIQALKDAKDLQDAKAAAIDALNDARKDYPSEAAEDVIRTYTSKIKAAKNTNDVTAEKNKGIQALKDAKDLQDAKAAAISDLNDATKDYPSDESEDIVSAYTGKINAATTTDAVTAAKEAGIQALAYAAEMPTVLHINFAEGSAPIEKEHYMVDSKFTLDEDCNVVLTVNSNSVTYPWDMAGKISLSKSVPTIELKANKDPESVSDYYTTFYSSLETYAIPEGVKAYTATMDEKQTGVILLNEIENGIIPAETAVVLISESDSYSAYSSTYAISETEEARGILKGTDVEISAAANCYILSGTSTLGMGLYPWAGEGKTLAANKAYLQLTESSQAKAFRFKFDDETTSIESLTPPLSEGEGVYNLQGIRVNDNYKGIVIKNGKKTLNK